MAFKTNCFKISMNKGGIFMNFLRKNAGITLIALVITVIVLIILAGITISMLSGENRNTN